MPRPVTRMAPKPSRFTLRSPPMVMVVGTGLAPTIVRLPFRAFASLARLPRPQLRDARFGSGLGLERLRLVKVRQVDDALAVGRAGENVDEAAVPQNLLRGVGETRMHRLVERLVDAGEEDDDDRLALAERVGRLSVKRTGLVDRVNDRPGESEERALVPHELEVALALHLAPVA